MRHWTDIRVDETKDLEGGYEVQLKAEHGTCEEQVSVDWGTF